ncbi:MAG: excisionase family DNA-binding protein [Chloroflexota bacterium]|nr:excisionase family DNA-binding protein [Chloroflexota bacterium]
MKLLEQGAIPFVKVGTHRRIKFSDLIEYKKYRDKDRQQGFAELSQLSQELGMYEE